MKKASAIVLAMTLITSTANAMTINIDESRYTIRKRSGTIYLTVKKAELAEKAGEEAGAFKCVNRNGDDIVWSKKDGAICTATIGQYVRHITK